MTVWEVDQKGKKLFYMEGTSSISVSNLDISVETQDFFEIWIIAENIFYRLMKFKFFKVIKVIIVLEQFKNCKYWLLKNVINYNYKFWPKTVLKSIPNCLAKNVIEYHQNYPKCNGIL